jgi:transcriptional regulator with XRE-family HTH domain
MLIISPRHRENILDPAIAFGKVLRAARKEANLTQEKLALEAGIERNFVSLIERGINQPTIRVLFKLAAALRLPPSKLVERTEQHVGL